MKESHREEVAHHTDPESCASRRKVTGEALTGAHADPALSCEIRSFGTPTPLRYAEGNMERGAKREPRTSPTQSETRSTRGSSSPRNWEIPRVPALDGEAGRLEKALGRTSSMHARGKSDEPIVPRKLPNKDGETRWRRQRREGVRPRGTLGSPPRPGLRAGLARRTDWRVCEKRRNSRFYARHPR